MVIQSFVVRYLKYKTSPGMSIAETVKYVWHVQYAWFFSVSGSRYISSALRSLRRSHWKVIMLLSKFCPILSCHYSSLPSLHPPQKLFHRTHSILKPKTVNPGTYLIPSHPFSSVGRGLLQICRDSTERKNFGGSFPDEKGIAVETSGDGGGSGNDWTTSVLLFGLWAGLMYYVFQLAPNQTPVFFLGCRMIWFLIF